MRTSPRVSKPKVEKEQLWKTNDQRANKEGYRRNVYWVSGDLYRGEWKANKRDGLGVHLYNNGNRYEGEWKNDKQEVKGALLVVDGGKYHPLYKGGWKGGTFHGAGVLYGEQGEIYDGQFEQGMRSGLGKQTYWCPTSKAYHNYSGQWAKDKREGFGTLKKVNGESYEGLFKNDLRDGKAVLYYADGKSKYEGLWKEDQAVCGAYLKIDGGCLPLLEVEKSQQIADTFIAEAIQLTSNK
ncbi:hypothetical protein O6H91_09G050500 [Diphasiastrum complanatum]|uniref:Uncharacterized protein n=1 Tax=Diphasiastrum complanatum TaxID=34168 RepID=A0ACC2CPA1_DIPCM|nr:hypothetical protein O6H91_09G050500 [Diphasiastrum complanatum]